MLNWLLPKNIEYIFDKKTIETCVLSYYGLMIHLQSTDNTLLVHLVLFVLVLQCCTCKGFALFTLIVQIIGEISLLTLQIIPKLKQLAVKWL